MKKLLAVLLTAALLLGALPGALASETPRAYIGPEGKLYLADTQALLFNQKINRILCETEDSAWVLADLSNNTCGLIRVMLSSGFATLTAVVDPENCVYAAAESAAYYLDSSGSVLMRADLVNGYITTASPLPFTDAYLQPTLTGVRIASYTNSYVSYAYAAATGLTGSDVPGNSVYECFDTMETIYTELNGFLARCKGEVLWRSVVKDYAWPILETDGKLLYFTEIDAAGKTFTVVHIYDPSTSFNSQLTVLENGFFKTAAVVGNKLYMCDVNGQLIYVDMTSGVSTSVHSYGSLATGIELEAVGSWAAVYNLSEDGLSYLARTSDYDYVPPVVVTPTVAPDPSLPSLQTGSKGEAVRKLQAALNAHGYNAGTADGSYGKKTAAAVKLLQSQLGLAETGIADSYIQSLANNGTMPDYSPYAPLTQGMVSTRVADMQARLSALGYFSTVTDGDYGPYTRASVIRFQSQVYLPVTGEADTETLQRLYSSDAPYCLTYYDLTQGNSGYAVTKLQERLRSLGYFEGTVNGSYDGATAQAVKFAQRDLSLTDNGVATASFQQTVFASSMSPAGKYVTLKKGDTSQRVWNLVDRLINMGYFNGDKLGYTYGEKTFDGVNLFAQTMGMPSPNGVATVAIQQALFADTAPMCPNPPMGNPHADPYADPEHTTYPDLDTSSSGKAVTNLQTRLKNLGYFEGSVNGTYDANTAQAVKFAQRALSMSDNGVATNAFQKQLYMSTMPAAGAYVVLKKGDTSQRVWNLVERLINMGYFNGDKLGYTFGDKTAAGIDLFAQVSGLPVPGGIATVSIQEALFSSSAKVNPNPPPNNPLAKGGGGGGGSAYSGLSQGSSGTAVSNLQQRLLNLNYYEGTVNGSYDSTTAQAVKFAQRALGLSDDGNASASFQQTLFSDAMPAAGDYVILKKGDTSQRVWDLVARLIDMGYFNGDKLGYTYGDKTVAGINEFAQITGLPYPDGIATVEIQRALYSETALVNPNPPPESPLAKANPNTVSVLTHKDEEDLTQRMNDAGIQSEVFSTDSAIQWIQQILIKQNYDIPEANGVYNAKTRYAMVKFSRDYNLENPTERIPDDAIIQKLKEFQ